MTEAEGGECLTVEEWAKFVAVGMCFPSAFFDNQPGLKAAVPIRLGDYEGLNPRAYLVVRKARRMYASPKSYSKVDPLVDTYRRLVNLLGSKGGEIGSCNDLIKQLYSSMPKSVQKKLG